jgi:hypothetical protein
MVNIALSPHSTQMLALSGETKRTRRVIPAAEYDWYL